MIKINLILIVRFMPLLVTPTRAWDFVVLVIISCFIAIPIGYYFMSSWLQKYEYSTEIS